MSDTIESLRARIAEVERERDEANASAVNAYTEACAARADAARLAEALRRARDNHEECSGNARDGGPCDDVRDDLRCYYCDAAAALAAWEAKP